MCRQNVDKRIEKTEIAGEGGRREGGREAGEGGREGERERVDLPSRGHASRNGWSASLASWEARKPPELPAANAVWFECFNASAMPQVSSRERICHQRIPAAQETCWRPGWQRYKQIYK